MKERPLVRIECREHFAAQILGHKAIVATERSHGPHRILDGPQPQPREDECGRPALGALDEHVDFLGAELELTELHEQLVRLPAVNARSAARTSTSAPAARSRESLSAGSTRAIRTTRTFVARRPSA